MDCFLTGKAAVIERDGEDYVVEVPFGSYRMERKLAERADPVLHPGQEYLYAALILQYRQHQRPLRFTEENIDHLLDALVAPATPLDQIDLIIRHLARTSPYGGYRVHYNPQNDYPIAVARSVEELVWLLNTGKELGYLEGAGYLEAYQSALTIRGWERYEALRTQGKDSHQAFVAMSFDPELRPIWTDGIRPALEKTGWKPMRIDEAEHNEKIDDQIIAEIRRSGLLIADLTLHRQNVYYEAGFAEGLDIPVIFTGREADMGEDRMHFDIRQYKFIPWTGPAQLEKALINRIAATGLGKH